MALKFTPTLLPQLLTYRQAAEYLNVPIGTLYTWVWYGQIDYIRLSPRAVRFSVAALDALIAAKRVPAGGEGDARGFRVRFGSRSGR